jgi:hypothetical protein
MMVKSICSVLVLAIFLSGCAFPNIDTSGPNFDETRYEGDLTECREGNGATAFLYGAGGALAGAFIGASNGAYYGAVTGGVGEGAIIGSLAGLVVGLGAGGVGAIIKNSKEVETCLRGKGYVIEGS